MSWPRAPAIVCGAADALAARLRNAASEPDTGASSFRNAEREPRYQWVGPARGGYRAVFGETLQPAITSLEQARRVGRIVLPRKWLSYDYLRQQGLNNPVQRTRRSR
jgi:polar amino acid transport system substrate-binding protein